MNEKRRGHVVCPNCGKESYVIVRRGEAEVWCRRCRRYFRIVIESQSKVELTDRG
jgi:ribosomal protein L37AE/L43A